MQKQKISKPDTTALFGIYIITREGVEGWMVGKDGDAAGYPSEDAANKAMKQLIRCGRYSWAGTTCEVRKF